MLPVPGTSVRSAEPEPRQLERLRTNLVEQAGSGEKAENSVERRGMRIGFPGWLIAILWSGGQQVGNSDLRDNVYCLRDAIAADEFEDFAQVLRRWGPN
jgi:hypothetical protein